MRERCFVAMSGGVDSAAAAYTLIKQGFDVRGVTLQMKPGDSALSDIEDARRVSGILRIPLSVLDVRDRFFESVIKPFAAEYAAGRTPSPCVYCNCIIKFSSVLSFARENGADFIATGHYALTEKSDAGEVLLKRSPSKKDQSYFLFRLNRDILSHTLFPIGSLSKEEVRAVAREAGLPVAEKGDSLEVCFIPDNDYAAFLEKNRLVNGAAGSFIDGSGAVLGEHAGIHRYTIGQRKGLGAFGAPKYVTCIDAAANTVTLGTNEELYSDTVIADDLSFIAGDAPGAEFSAQVKIRSAARPATAHVRLTEGKAVIVFDEKQRAASPGQAAVFYDGDTVLGGGRII